MTTEQEDQLIVSTDGPNIWTFPDGELRVSRLGPSWLVFFRDILVFKSEADSEGAPLLPDGLLFRRHGTYLLRNAWGEVRMPTLGVAEQTLLEAIMSQRTPGAEPLREIVD